MGVMNLVTTVIASAYSTVVSKAAIDKCINGFLSYDDDKTFNANSILHWSLELTTSAAQYGRTTGGTRGNKDYENGGYSIDSLVFGAGSVLPDAQWEEFINKLNAAVCVPNLEGIPIFSAKMSTRRDILLSEQNIILPADNVDAGTGVGAVKRGIYVDNAVPRLRTWDIQGYILSIMPILDYRAQVKPSLLLEMDYIDAIAKSGKPVWFKTHTNEFVRAQVQGFSFEFTPEINTGVAVTLSLKEYSPLRITTNAATDGALDPVSSAPSA